MKSKKRLNRKDNKIKQGRQGNGKSPRKVSDQSLGLSQKFSREIV